MFLVGILIYCNLPPKEDSYMQLTILGTQFLNAGWDTQIRTKIFTRTPAPQTWRITPTHNTQRNISDYDFSSFSAISDERSVRFSVNLVWHLVPIKEILIATALFKHLRKLTHKLVQNQNSLTGSFKSGSGRDWCRLELRSEVRKSVSCDIGK